MTNTQPHRNPAEQAADTLTAALEAADINGYALTGDDADIEVFVLGGAHIDKFATVLHRVHRSGTCGDRVLNRSDSDDGWTYDAVAVPDWGGEGDEPTELELWLGIPTSDARALVAEL